MGRYRRSRTHKAIKDVRKKIRLRRRTKDLDQIHGDLDPEQYQKLKNQEIDPDLPGLAQFYCVECSKYFVSQNALDKHTLSKIHKKRVKALKEEPYTLKEAELAVGLSTETKRAAVEVAPGADMLMDMIS